ncbi:MAG: DEAD/DEAH box helicase family protein, partial [Tissierellales bacterium]|nr:DEAD/DEAH box helicase family protein [Tissierellales bacterium]
MSHYIYAYSTQHYFENHIKNNELPWIKIGSTINIPQKRIREQDKTANPEVLNLIKYWETPHSDHEIHRILETDFGVLRVRDGREWFACTIDKVDSAINMIKNGIPRPDSYLMRDEQREAVEKAISFFRKGGKTFLFNAKMRFGKTFAAYQLMKRLSAQKILILTYVPVAVDQWATDLDRHIDFENYKFLYALDFDKNNPINFSKKKGNVLFASFQDILGNDLNSVPKAKWAKILDQHYDLIIIDEAHWGYGTLRAEQIMKKLSYDKLLLMSGTPLHLLMSGDFTIDDTYTWSYMDEQKKRSDEEKTNWQTENYKWLPKMNLFTYELGEQILNHVSNYSSNEGPNLASFFASNDSKSFVNKAAVEKWADLLWTEDERIFPSPFNNNITSNKLNHLFWFLSGVNSINAMAKFLREHYRFKDYQIVIAADNNEGAGADTLLNVRKAILSAPNKKTITLSCGKLTMGVTIKEWNSVFMLSNTESPEQYWQTVFRVQSSNKADNKTECFVFDFEPNRAFKMIYSYNEILAKKGVSTIQTIREFLDCMKVLAYSDNKLVNIDEKKIVSCGINPDESIKKFESKRTTHIVKFDQAIYDMLKHIKGVKNKIFESELTKSPIDEGEDLRNSRLKIKVMKKKSEYIESLRQKIISIIKNLPVFMFISDEKEECLEDILKTKEMKLF